MFAGQFQSTLQFGGRVGSGKSKNPRVRDTSHDHVPAKQTAAADVLSLPVGSMTMH